MTETPDAVPGPAFLGTRVSVRVLPAPTGLGTPVWVEANVTSAPAETAVVTVALLFEGLEFCSFAAIVTVSVTFPPPPLVVLTTNVMFGRDPTTVDPVRVHVTVPAVFEQDQPIPAAET